MVKLTPSFLPKETTRKKSLALLGLMGKETKVYFAFFFLFGRVKIITGKVLQVSFAFKLMLCSV